MKTRIQKSIILAITIYIFFSVVSVYSQSSRMKDNFYLGFFNYTYEPNFQGTIFMNDYKSFSLNAMQGYGNVNDHDPYHYSGGFYDSLSSYYSNVSNMLNTFNTNLADSSMLLQRAKITRPAYGQRSTYEAEYGRTQIVNGPTKPGYGFKHGVNNFYTREPWQGDTVSGRYCKVGQQAAQYIVDSLYENLEQVNNIGDNFIYSDTKANVYSDYRWYIKPRMRIRQSVANDSSNWNKNVVRIEIINFDGSVNPTINLLVRNFLDSNLIYNGSYLEIYNMGNISPYPLSVKATSLAQGAAVDYQGKSENLTSSQVDYRVYWYGEVDVWLDYVRVDDEWAHFLFTDLLDNNPDNRHGFYGKLTEEVTAFGDHIGFGNFYVDEYTYNCIPCIAKVNSIIKSINPRTGLVSVTCENCTLYDGLRNSPSFDSLYNSLYNKGVNTDILLTDRYPVYTVTPIPSNLNKPNSGTYIGTVNYRKATTAQHYNDSLNNYLFNNAINSEYKKVSQFAKEHDLVFSLAVQTHNFEIPLLCHPEREDLREPTN